MQLGVNSLEDSENRNDSNDELDNENPMEDAEDRNDSYDELDNENPMEDAEDRNDSNDELDNENPMEDAEDRNDSNDELDNENPMEDAEDRHDSDSNQDDEPDQPEDENDALAKQNIALICALIAKHHCTSSLTDDLLKVIQSIMPGFLPKNRYFLFKFIQDKEYKTHYVCKNCYNYLGPNPEITCQCSAEIDKNDLYKNYMYILTVDLKFSITQLCLHTEFLKHIDKRNKRGLQTGKLYSRYKDFLSEGNYNLTLTFGTDGGLVHKSKSKMSLWPIFITVNELPPEKQATYMMLHSLWFGAKPNPGAFFHPLINEINEINEHGLNVTLKNGEMVTIKLRVLMGIMDAPARAHMQNIKQFNGIFGCGYCEQKGESIDGAIRFPLLDEMAILKTHITVMEYARQAVENDSAVKGVKGFSPLKKFEDFDIVRGCPPDTMHQVYHGVVRRTVMSWFDAKSILPALKVEDFDKMLLKLKTPSSITRKPRTLKDRFDYKATEWKNFVLYYCPFVITALPRNYQKHFLLLSFSLHILNSENASRPDLQAAHLACLKFLEGLPQLYGENNCTYNAHILSHLATFYQWWGPLWAYSAFRFEDGIRQLNFYHHGANRVNIQTVKHYVLHHSVQQMCTNAFNHESASEEKKTLYAKLSGIIFCNFIIIYN